jgi:tetratricopeptide (TPR) repeat protein
MVFAFGGNGNMDGYFRRPSAIEHVGRELYVVDSLDCSITSFVPTEFGNTVYKAMDTFDEGKYDESGEAWREVMKMNGNYDLAYIGIGRTLLRQKNYKEAMKYFELKYDAQNYSKAFKQYRKQWVEEHIVLIVVIILLLFLVPLGIGRLKFIKHEIDTADIFQL